jgi:hypothetical protein
MLNQDIYSKNPLQRKLVNEGVANVNDDVTTEAMAVLRYELETFVCDGQYEKGIKHILETYLANLGSSSAKQQPGVWVSGFYGSGKSHLVKMLRALWVDTTFEDGATARGIANLPEAIKTNLKELSIQGKRHNRLHAASGTLGSGASGSVRLALLRILFKSVGLPESYPLARFVMWLKHDGIFEAVKAHVENHGNNWEEELDNYLVADSLHEALVATKPNLFSSIKSCSETLREMFPNVSDVSNEAMLKSIKETLGKDGKLPLTLLVLDEVQQFIGEDSDRSIAVQEMIESVTKNLGVKILMICTGQTAVTGTPNLARLQGRFTVRIELSDSDVDAVIRQVILAKKPEVKGAIEEVMVKNVGEISRQLQSSSIAHRQSDMANFTQDYPILPVRRRFWENALRVLDQTGTDSQLRNQLSMVHKVIQNNADKPLGHVVGADYLYFDSAEKLLQSRVVPRKVYEKTMSWYQSKNPDELLLARACGLVFLINRLVQSNKEVSIRCTADTLADLMVEDLAEGSGQLRNKLPALLDKCELVMKVGDEYRIQTEESTAWNDEFRSQQHKLSNELHRIESERFDRIRKKIGDVVHRITLSHGLSKVPRSVDSMFDSALPSDANQRIYAWIRNGWDTDENSVRAEARTAGNSSPTIFVFVPKRSPDDVRRNIIDYKAAIATIESKGQPTGGGESEDAYRSIDTIRQKAESSLNDLLQDAFNGARVFQGGGSEITGFELLDAIRDAAQSSLARLYPKFTMADHVGWSKVYERACDGAPDSLKAVNDAGEAIQNPVCKEILNFIANGKSGTDIRNTFESAPYGWSRDAVDGGLWALLISGAIRATGENGKAADHTLERKFIGKAKFQVESIQIKAPQLIKIRKLYQALDMPCASGQESIVAGDFVTRMIDLANRAGGDAPRPQIPKLERLLDVRQMTGNQQLLQIFNESDVFLQWIEDWRKLAQKINERMPEWVMLQRLMRQANGLEDSEVLATQVNHIENGRLLLDDPNPMRLLVASLTQMLREQINAVQQGWNSAWEEGEGQLKNDENWKKLDPEQKNDVRTPQGLVQSALPVFDVSSVEGILNTLENTNLTNLHDRIVALPGRYQKVVLDAARLLEPKVQAVKLPSRTLKTEADVDAWLQEAKATLILKLKQGPVMP